ncbi:hypothetical protein [Streptomyces sp. Y1]|uniref:Uncharacterized protein n=1 Tax=Streptomyces sp. Y1 TaxID=3238634 RepID=A0AB39TVV3_9ACTN
MSRKAVNRDEAARLREQIAQLGRQLATVEHQLERLEITRKTVLGLVTPAPTCTSSRPWEVQRAPDRRIEIPPNGAEFIVQRTVQ